MTVFWRDLSLLHLKPKAIVCEILILVFLYVGAEKSFNNHRSIITVSIAAP